jgi:glucose/arabinose dehydrogenase
VIASRDGKRLFATVGSNSNVGEKGVEAEIRNPNGLSWQPESGELWVVVNERDEIGSGLVPDYMTAVRRGGFYGWPYSYFGQHVDVCPKPSRPDLIAKAIKPDYALGPHTASLGLTFYTARLFGPQYQGRRLRRSARLLEPQSAERIQGNLRALQKR